MKYNLVKIGNRIRVERRKLRMNQTNFGKKLKGYKANGFNRDTVASWEKGESLPDLDIMLKMCEIFNCELGYLLCEFETKTRVNADIQQETGLSETEIDILRRANGDAPDLLGVKKPTTKTKLIGAFICGCDSIAKELDLITGFGMMPTALQAQRIDLAAVTDMYMSVHIDDRLHEHDRWNAFRDQFLQKYPEWDDNNYIMDMYMTIHAKHSGNIKASRFVISQEFNKIINKYIEQK